MRAALAKDRLCATPRVESSPGRCLPLVGAAVAVVALFGWIIAPSRSDPGNSDARRAHYNRLIDGFGAGQLHLAVAVPPGLAQLPDPYDPQANHVYRMQHDLHDTSFYKGRIYLYYGPTPALLLFGPYHWITGGYLFNKTAAFAFTVLGYLASVLLLHSIWRRHFATVPAWIVASCALALGTANSIPGLLGTPAVCEVAIACAYAFAMLACLGIWHALHDARRRNLWLGFASVAYGLAVGARPSVLFGAVVLLIPLVTWWRERQPTGSAGIGLGRPAAAAIMPILLIGVGLAAYNHLRFGDIFEFGQRYQLASERQDTGGHFAVQNVGYNFRLYFLERVPWSETFPFVQKITPPPAPANHGPVESAHGIFTNTPVALFAFAMLAGWRRRHPGELRALLVALGILFAANALVICLFYWTVLRYQADFHPVLVLLAAAGFLGFEAASTAWVRRAWRALWLLALGFSVAFTVLASFRARGEEFDKQGVLLAQAGDRPGAIALLERALRLVPALASAHTSLGVLHLDGGNPTTAAVHFVRALELAPPSPDTLNGLGRALAALERWEEAAEQFRHAIAIDPKFAHGHLNLGTALFHLGQPAQAASHYQQAIDHGLDSPEVREALALMRTGVPAAAGTSRP